MITSVVLASAISLVVNSLKCGSASSHRGDVFADHHAGGVFAGELWVDRVAEAV